MLNRSKPNDRIRGAKASVMIIVFLVGLIIVTSQSSSAMQIDTSREQEKNEVEEEQEKTSEIRIGQSALIQSYRVRRTQEKQDVQLDGTEKLKQRNRVIQIETVDDIRLPHMNAIEVFSRQLPRKNGLPRVGHQIVVEMKKVTADKKDRSIGVFAADSWIESKNGKVELFTNRWNFAPVQKNRYWIGVRCNAVTTEGTDSKNSYQLIVDEVVSDSAAEMAGVKTRDEIVSWNSMPLKTVDGLVSAIQSNQDQVAKIGIKRRGKKLSLDIKPLPKDAADVPVRTVIVPAAKLNIAEQKIAELQNLVAVDAGGLNQQVRVLLVGPGVNFGREEIELQVNPEIHTKHVQLKKLLDHVAEKKYGVFIKDNSFTLKSSPEAKDVLGELDIEPHEIWETMQFGVDGKTFTFQQLAPRMIHQTPVEIEVKAEEIARKATKNLVQKLKTGQIVFPNPLSTLRQELQVELIELQKENERIRSQNEALREAIKKLKSELKK